MSGRGARVFALTNNPGWFKIAPQQQRSGGTLLKGLWVRDSHTLVVHTPSCHRVVGRRRHVVPRDALSRRCDTNRDEQRCTMLLRGRRLPAATFLCIVAVLTSIGMPTLAASVRGGGDGVAQE